ncbi:MAG: gliding motility lipoprotein GldH [Ginsengibacter sp.]
MKKNLFTLLLPLFFVSCIQVNLFEKQSSIPSQLWYYNNVPKFTFHIEDTTSKYNVYIVLRHTDLYKYNNLWLRVGSTSPVDSMHYQNINLVLATDATGWEGSGMDDIFEVRKNISAGPLTFKIPGDYTFSIAQIMRENPLQYILNVGVRVEKVKL